MSACDFPDLSAPDFPDILAAIEAALAALGITIPDPPSIPLPAPFCPLD